MRWNDSNGTIDITFSIEQIYSWLTNYYIMASFYVDILTAQNFDLELKQEWQHS